MSDDARLLLDVWEVVRDHLPPAKREVAAIALMRVFADHGYDARDLAAVKDEDEDLDVAFEEVFSDPETDVEDTEEDH